MPTCPPDVFTTLQPTSLLAAELERLGDEIAELSAHLEAATARLLALIREFESSTPAAAGTPASGPARRGSLGAWDSLPAPPVSTCAWRGPSALSLRRHSAWMWPRLGRTN